MNIGGSKGGNSVQEVKGRSFAKSDKFTMSFRSFLGFFNKYEQAQKWLNRFTQHIRQIVSR